jgi:hypothetical protein
MLANWVQFEMEKILNTINVDFLLKFQLYKFLIFHVVETCSKSSPWFQILYYSKI